MIKDWKIKFTIQTYYSGRRTKGNYGQQGKSRSLFCLGTLTDHLKKEYCLQEVYSMISKIP